MKIGTQILQSTPIRLAAKGRWMSILGNLCPELETALARPGRHGMCPVHGGRDGFRLFRDVEVSGGGICNSCGPRPDGFALLMWLRNWSFPNALAAVNQALDGVTFSTRLPKRMPNRQKVTCLQATDSQIRMRLRKTWKEALPWNAPKSALLRTYLLNRGLEPNALNDRMPLRFHPSLPYLEEGVCRGHYPAMLALVSGADGQPATIHRTYLTPDGQKAPVPSPKKLMPHPSDRTLTGGAVRLGLAAPCLGIAEGIETALAVHQATGMTVWSALSCTLLERFQPPEGTEQVVIWSDLDENGAGQSASEALRKRLQANGIESSVLLPPAIGMDWLDVWNQFGVEGFHDTPARLVLAARTSQINVRSYK